MKLNFTKQLWLMLMWLMTGVTAFAQRALLDVALEHVRTHYQEWNLTAQDVSDMIVSDMYTDKTTGITRVYLLQRYQGIPVFNAILNLNISKEGKVFHVGNRFMQDLAGKVNTTVPVLDAEGAVKKVVEHLGLKNEPLRLAQKIDEQEYIFDKGNIASENISVKLRYQPYRESARLSWHVALAPVKSSDMWSIRVDAVAGSILDKNNWTVYCNIGPNTYRHLDGGCNDAARHNLEALTYNFSIADAQYNIWPVPYESPIHGPRTLVTNPADPVASPYGWHDTDGQPGAEFTITRGNNVHAYEDSGDGDSSAVNEPDGGADLLFDFQYDANWEPAQYQDAAVVNLFYMNNFMHDFAHHYGFDEAAGNFQVNNYGNGGAGNDNVRAEGQDGGGTDNANFSTPPDGSKPRMQMYLWGSAGKKLLTVNAPASVEGKYITIEAGTGWGPGAYVTSTPVTADVVIVNDGVPNTANGCEPIQNAAQLTGKVALIDRGDCEFGFKAVAAQNAGAIALIICNIAGASPTTALGAGAVGGQVNIPVVMISEENCQTIRQYAGSGLNVTFVDSGQPSQLDGDLDNGIIAHEFGHGISNRLTGGASNTDCLNNAEQMGEGWSDFMSLVFSVYPGDTGTKKRGVGTYVANGEVIGNGIRRYPYTTDMSVNPLTYGDVAANTEVHALGEVWTAMLWDLYWAFVDEYGWDPDLYNGTGGNNLAIRLVFEGMKNQPCNPGFKDGRDGILKADMELFGGANECIIWKAFARRGLGVSAIQGSPSDATDQVEAFDIPPACINAVTIEKTVTDLINAGDDITVTIKVGNYKQETVTNVTVTDEIPDGTAFKAGSSSHPANVQGNVVSIELPDMAFLNAETITFKLTTSPDNYSVRHWLDDVPDEIDDNWLFYSIPNPPSPDASNVWETSDSTFHSPDYSWFIEDIEAPSRQALELDVPWQVTGSRPTLRFYHRYNTEFGSDGGLVEVREKDSLAWKPVAFKILRNDYTGILQYGGAFAEGNLYAFSGNSGPDFEATYVNLSEWAGKTIQIRYRFGTDDNTAGEGWFVDDIEFMDLFNYNGEACITTDQGDNECAIAPEEGTIVESQLPTNAVFEPLEDVQIAVFPNPAHQALYIAFDSDRQQKVSVNILTVDGREVMARSMNVLGNDVVSLNVSSLPKGFYLVKVSTEDGMLVKKVVIE